MTFTQATPSLVTNPDLDRWINFDVDKSVRIATGKVEIGQGIVTAIAQIAAEELDISLDAVSMLSGSSVHGPDEMYTTSSLSVDVSGGSVRLVCAEVRARMLDRVAQRLNCNRDLLSVAAGEFLLDGKPTGFDYWRIAPEVDLVSPMSAAPAVKSPDTYTVVGTSVARIDLPAKVSGAAFVHDMSRANLLHARVLRQPGSAARLEALDEAAIVRASKGELRCIRRGNFVALVSADEAAVQRGAAAAPAHACWSGETLIDDNAQHASWLNGRRSKRQRLGAPVSSASGNVTVTSSYSRPHVAHAAMGPSCALAEMRDGHLTVWSHGQGMHPLQKSLSAALGLDISQITTHHVQGPGCYGHNGADDAALDAAIIAIEIPDHCIRVQWRREEEFAFEPFGTAMQVNLSVEVDHAGQPTDWTTEIWSGVHVQRPGRSGGYLLAESALRDDLPALDLVDPPEVRGGGGTRNAVPLYDLRAHRIDHHLVLDVPVRTSALRGLGALPNVFAIESMIDELAERAGADPIDYRLALLSDPRARNILTQVADRANWRSRGAGGSGQGLGLGLARYKNSAAYAAVVAAVDIDEVVRVTQVWCVADAGLVVNPDGARNQLEGGIVQGTSWALKEEVKLDEGAVASLNWDTYPILRFSEVPLIHAELVDASNERTLGVGECTIGPTAAAIANAVAHALGVRLRDMPLNA